MEMVTPTYLGFWTWAAPQLLFALKPVTFRYKQQIDPAATSQFGLVAEDVEKVNPASCSARQGGETLQRPLRSSERDVVK
jgi:hypothetical protein